MNSRSAAKKLSRPASKPVTKSSPRKAKAKLAKVTRFPTAKVARKPLAPMKKSAPPPPQKRPASAPPRAAPARADRASPGAAAQAVAGAQLLLERVARGRRPAALDQAGHRPRPDRALRGLVRRLQPAAPRRAVRARGGLSRPLRAGHAGDGVRGPAPHRLAAPRARAQALGAVHQDRLAQRRADLPRPHRRAAQGERRLLRRRGALGGEPEGRAGAAGPGHLRAVRVAAERRQRRGRAALHPPGDRAPRCRLRRASRPRLLP